MKKKIMLGVPAYGGMHPQYVVSLCRLLAKTADMQPILHMIRGDSLVSRARNKITSAFLASDCDYLLQLDTDIEFSAERMRAMIDRELPIIGGTYFLKRIEPIPCANGLPDVEKKREDGLERVKFIGTGMLLVHREVFEAQVEQGLVEEYQADDDETQGKRIWDFWRVGVQPDPISGRKRYLSEDWYFCLNAAKAGYEIYCDKQNIGRHYGEIAYPLDFDKLAKVLQTEANEPSFQHPQK